MWPQPDHPTAGGALLDRLEAALGRRVGAYAVTARTDAGVHANLNLATVRLWKHAGPLDLSPLRTPRDDGLSDVRAVRGPHTVYARGLAVAKRYVYAWDQPLDRDAMQAAAAHLRGTHDVSAIRGRRVSPERCRDLTLDRVDVEADGTSTRLVVEGARFVRHQVRIMATLLADVGRGDRHPDELADILISRDTRHGAGPAPGTGLTLSALRLQDRPDVWVDAPDQVDLQALCEVQGG